MTFLTRAELDAFAACQASPDTSPFAHGELWGPSLLRRVSDHLAPAQACWLTRRFAFRRFRASRTKTTVSQGLGRSFGRTARAAVIGCPTEEHTRTRIVLNSQLPPSAGARTILSGVAIRVLEPTIAIRRFIRVLSSGTVPPQTP